ncbi:hypothetical protein BSKO_07432 [Bryopsis sp. KO-2023]|nr:hypothetical protein BSKO_07432 [Bryopsis sp. KO-2023]
MVSEAPGGAPTQRLMIRAIELENFKSYAGVVHVGPFHKKCSCVVGPNGSGKSNIIDAMMFVFGKKATKLRLKKVSGIIHKSAKHPNFQYARVTVHFQEILDEESDNGDPIPGSEFSITRSATSENKSEYFINADKASFKDVAEVMLQKGIDLKHNRFLILQGEIEMISSMKSKGEKENEIGFLEYFEEIIGTNVYIEQIETLQKEMDDLTDKSGILRERLASVQRRKENLEGPRKEGEAYLAKAAKIEENRILQLSQVNLSDQESASGTKTQLDAHLQKISQEEMNNAGVMDLEAKEKKEIETGTQALAALDAELKLTQSRFAECDKQDSELSANQKFVGEKLDKLLQTHEKLAESLEAAQNEIEEAEGEIPELQQQLASIQASYKEQEEVLKQMQLAIRGELEPLHRELSEASSALTPFKERIEQVGARKKCLETEKKGIIEKQEARVKTLESTKQGASEAGKAVVEKQKKVEEMQEELQDLRQKAATEQQNIVGLEAEERRVEGLVNEVRETERMKRAAADSLVTQNETMRLLMDAKRSGKIPGFHGKLGHLGAIDPKYDIPMSVACSKLDFYVIDTMKEATIAGALLRSARMRVVTFIALDRITYLMSAMNKRFRAPDGAQRLFDLVRCADEKFRLPFYFACRDTMVVNDLETGVRVNSGSTKFRLVTLKGEMMEISGAMSGGGARPRGGRICLGNAAPEVVDPQVAVNELEAVAALLRTHIQEHQDVMEKCTEAKRQGKRFETEGKALERNMRKAESDVEAAKAEVQAVNQRMAQLEKEIRMVGPDQQKLQELEAEMERCDAEIADINSRFQTELGREKAAQERIDNAGGPQMKGQKYKIEQLKQEIKTAEGRLEELSANLAKKTREADRIRKEAGSIEKQKEKLCNEKETLTKELKELHSKASRLLSNEERLGKLKEEKDAALSELRKKFETTSRQGNSTREGMARLEVKKKALETKLGELEKRIVHRQRQIDEHAAKYCNLLPDAELPKPSREELDRVNPEALGKECTKLASQLERMNPQTAALQEYRRREGECNDRLAELDELKNQYHQVESNCAALGARRKEEFLDGFNKINRKLKQVFRFLTREGQAELDWVDNMDPFQGVEFTVRPAYKAWKKISDLSGGEKTLSSLSLVMALHHFKPTPLYVMDEIDAALDWRNVEVAARYISERTQSAQFVIVSLRQQMYEKANHLMGIYKINDCTLTVAMMPSAFEAKKAHCNGVTPTDDVDMEDSQE